MLRLWKVGKKNLHLSIQMTYNSVVEKAWQTQTTNGEKYEKYLLYSTLFPASIKNLQVWCLKVMKLLNFILCSTKTSDAVPNVQGKSAFIDLMGLVSPQKVNSEHVQPIPSRHVRHAQKQFDNVNKIYLEIGKCLALGHVRHAVFCVNFTFTVLQGNLKWEKIFNGFQGYYEKALSQSYY